jgi:anthranilate phosphoribosyltransferase
VNSESTATEILGNLLARHELAERHMRWIIEEMVSGRSDQGLAAAFLMGLRMKGETATEIAVAADVLRAHMVRWHPGRDDVLDTCGTGGDSSGTFNISTATALVVAAAGVPVVKHGNRSASSRSGSADVLSVLGVVAQASPVRARICLDQVGLAFCFAPMFHPALKHVGPLRRQLGIATIFNWLGPLANPAGAAHQLLGVGRLDMLDRMAEALGRLGTKRSLVIHSRDGLDEVSLAAPTLVREVVGNQVKSWDWTPAEFGLPTCSIADWRAVDAQDSARIIEEMLAGHEGPCAWVVQANAAAALWLTGRVSDLAGGVKLAAEAMASGKARQVLDNLRRLCNDEGVTDTEKGGPA